MKNKFYLFIIFLVPCMVFGQISTVTLASADLQGKVKTVTEREYRGISAGHIYTHGKLVSESLSSYNRKGNLTDLVYFYNELKDTSIRKYSYDKYNSLAEERWVTGNSIVHYKIRNNNMGKPEEKEHYNERGKTGYKEIYRYNSNGLPVEIVSFEGKKESGTEKFNYNSEGELFSRQQEGEKYFFDTYTDEYDNRGNIIKSVYLSSFESSKRIFLYKYNTDNLRTEQYMKRSSPGDPDEEEKTLYEYIFDKKNNWIKCTGVTTSATGKEAIISEREIKYYE